MSPALGACAKCVAIKKKCDHKIPACSHCIKIGEACLYPKGKRRRGPIAGLARLTEERVRHCENVIAYLSQFEQVREVLQTLPQDGRVPKTRLPPGNNVTERWETFPLRTVSDVVTFGEACQLANERASGSMHLDAEMDDEGSKSEGESSTNFQSTRASTRASSVTIGDPLDSLDMMRIVSGAQRPGLDTSSSVPGIPSGDLHGLDILSSNAAFELPLGPRLGQSSLPDARRQDFWPRGGPRILPLNGANEEDHLFW